MRNGGRIMNRWISIALFAVGAAILSSPGWAKDNPKPNAPNASNNGNAFGQAGDGNPQYQWRRAEESVEHSNQVLESTPDNVCQNPVSAAPGRNPHCPASP